jgi:choline dehydrogenase-like flavoprotein
LQNEITVNGLVGARFHALGGVLMTADMAQPLDGFDKIGLCAAAVPLHRKYLLETFFSPPGSMAITLGGWGKSHSDRMKRFSHMAQAGAMIGTGSHGRLSRAGAGLKIDLTLNQPELLALREGLKQLAQVYLCAGAQAIYPGTFRDLTLRNAGDVAQLDGAVERPDDVTFGSAHPQGGNAMSDDVSIGVVDSQFRVRGFDNLSIVDASVMPENLWANCQATTMALAHVASDFVAASL